MQYKLSDKTDFQEEYHLDMVNRVSFRYCSILKHKNEYLIRFSFYAFNVFEYEVCAKSSMLRTVENKKYKSLEEAKNAVNSAFYHYGLNFKILSDGMEVFL